MATVHLSLMFATFYQFYFADGFPSRETPFNEFLPQFHESLSSPGGRLLYGLRAATRSNESL